jgi:hypothetical protein
MKEPRPRSASPGLPELETVTDYRMIALGGGLLLAFLAIPLAATLFTGSRTEPPAVAAVKSPRPAPAESADPAPQAAPIRPQLSFPPAEPYQVRKSPAPRPPAIAPVPADATPASRTAAASTPKKDSPPAPPSFKRRTDKHNPYEYELLAMLRTDVKEVGLDTEAGTSKGLLAKSGSEHPVLDLLAKRSDLAGLPARQAAECRATPEGVKTLKDLSEDLRFWRQSRSLNTRDDENQTVRVDWTKFVSMTVEISARWKQADCVSILEQVLQGEETTLRSLLVKQLAKIPGPAAGAALARRAVFDVSASVREEAVDALKRRPPAEPRPVLLAALRYPWAPAADHAAEALVNLGDKAAAGDLVKLRDLPDPCVPALDADKKKWLVPELVRVNHLGNCLLCHAPSTDRKDTLRAPVPEAGQPLPLIYYEGVRGPAARFDVTYLRQDFSVPHQVENAAPWPDVQRFDYLVRKREVPADEGAARAAAAKGRDYPQREAVLFTLRELTGAKSGD